MSETNELTQVDWNSDEAVVVAAFPHNETRDSFLGDYSYDGHVVITRDLREDDGVDSSWHDLGQSYLQDPAAAWSSARQHPTVQAFERLHNPSYASPTQAATKIEGAYEMVPYDEALAIGCGLCNAVGGAPCTYDNGAFYPGIHLQRHAKAYFSRSPTQAAQAEPDISSPTTARGWIEDGLGRYQVTHIHAALREALKLMPVAEPESAGMTFDEWWEPIADGYQYGATEAARAAWNAALAQKGGAK